MITTGSIELRPLYFTENALLPEVELTSVKTDLGQLSVARSGDYDGSGSITLCQPWSGYVRRTDVAELISAMSATSGTDVISTDNFGMGNMTARPDARVAAEIRQGNFDSIALAQLQAIGESPDGQRTLMGYSLGASITAAQAKNTQEHVDRLILFEGVVEPVPLPILVARFAFEGLTWGKYIKQNPDWMVKRGSQPFMPKGTLPHIRPYWNYPQGLSKGHIFDDLKAARERETITKDTKVVLASGSKSRVSSVEANYKLAERIQKELGITSVRHLEFVGESHGIIDSAPRFTAATMHLMGQRDHHS